MARLMGAGDVMVEYDQRYEHFGVPHPQLLAEQLGQTPLGLTNPISFGSPRPNVSTYSTLNEQDLAAPAGVAWPAPIVDYTVANPRPLLRAESDGGAIVAEGDATGLDNLAGLGLLNPNNAIYYAGTLAGDPTRLRQLASQGAHLVLTDTNRKQAFQWASMTANNGYTETPSDNPAKTDPSDSPIELFPDAGVSTKSMASYVGAVNVTAKSYGNGITYNPEYAPYSAIDGNFDTAWITGHLRPRPSRAVVAGAVRATRSPRTTSPSSSPSGATAPAGSPPSRLTFDGKDPDRFELTAASHVPSRPDTHLPHPHLPHSPRDHRRHDRRPPELPRCRRRRILRGRGPRTGGAPARPHADADALQPRSGLGSPTGSPWS